MKVALDLSVVEFDTAGSGIYARSLSEHLSRLAGAPSLELLSFRRLVPERLPFMARVLFHDLVWVPWLVTREAKRSRADLLHVPAYKVPPAGGLPLVVTFHDLSLLDLPHTFGPWFRVYSRVNLLGLSSRVSLLLTDSEFSKTRIVERLAFPAERVRVIPLGLQERFCRPAPESERKRVRSRFDLREPYILFVGTLERRKNLRRLIDCFRSLRNDIGIRHQLVLAGRAGRGSGEIRQRTEELGLQSQVRFLGRIADEDLPGLYAGAELFVYLSVYEGFGLPPLEALSQGGVVLVSDRASLPEVVGDAGLLVDPADEEQITSQMRRALTDSALRRALSNKAARRARRFTWEETARQTLEAYRFALEAPPSRR